LGGFAHLLDGASAVISTDSHHIATAVVAAVLAWSGTAKLRRPLPAAWALVDFGVVRHVHPRAGLALGLLEAGLAGALVLGLAAGGALAALAASAAALLLAAFAAAIARSLARGASFNCACFGAGDSPLSTATLGRAVLLSALSAALAVTAGAAGPVPSDDALAQALVAGTAITATAALVAAGRPLVRWNDDPFGLDDGLFESWSPR
jgi:hypothetical protein